MMIRHVFPSAFAFALAACGGTSPQSSQSSQALTGDQGEQTWTCTYDVSARLHANVPGYSGMAEAEANASIANGCGDMAAFGLSAPVDGATCDEIECEPSSYDGYPWSCTYRLSGTMAFTNRALTVDQVAADGRALWQRAGYCLRPDTCTSEVNGCRVDSE